MHPLTNVDAVRLQHGLATNRAATRARRQPDRPVRRRRRQ
jgi:hypothetical protein